MTTHPVSILVVDDHPMFRNAICDILNDMQCIGRVSQAASGEECLARFVEESYDLILLDINMPGINGLETLIRIIRKKPEQKVAILTQYDSPKFYQNALDLGAIGYIVKGVDCEDFTMAIQDIIDHESLVLSGSMTNTLDDNALSAREIEIMLAIGNEMNSKQIAHQLCISVNTVNCHRAAILNKLGVKNVGGVVKWAIKHGYMVVD